MTLIESYPGVGKVFVTRDMDTGEVLGGSALFFTGPTCDVTDKTVFVTQGGRKTLELMGSSGVAYRVTEETVSVTPTHYLSGEGKCLPLPAEPREVKAFRIALTHPASDTDSTPVVFPFKVPAPLILQPN
ncbi:hypothetical protein KRR26_20850 [Corallococcus sp. M34]|uniref:hypothetical protein n=1 Tax=Citreicoccus inhibens TaxID=2849499 RepID=UPI0011C4760B|nr:hypothetical protein [Citreicoccus inhibens]MBU8898069.1 hypothetical protein [Citreicoccus inhibens]